MKTILIDAMYTLIDTNGILDEKIQEILDRYDNPKIILTNMRVETFQKYAMDLLPYPVFTLSREPSKLEPLYFEMLMEEYSIFAHECLYIEHNKEVVACAESVGINTNYFDSEKRDLKLLEEFLENNI